MGETYHEKENYYLKCYATNFNRLIIKGGMAALKFQN